MKYSCENRYGRVYRGILKQLEEKGSLVFQQVDPPELGVETAGKIAKIAAESGIDAFAVGGSVGAQGKLLDDVILALKENSKLPVILFPGNIATISKHADAVYFMYVMNSLDPYWSTGAQTAASYPIKQLGLETIPTAYIIVEPGRAVGWISRAQTVPRHLPYLAGITALAGQYMGASLAILESGGGAESPAPRDMIAYTRQLVDIPIVVAGGVRDEKFAYESVKAGADILHVGTAIEKANGDLGKCRQLISALCNGARKAAKERK
ncbi:MAG TPA: geranylgeranylglyceryl/heptaprenylglyceryl phosphate synthase [Candidatus Diapherotrites archaeon]|uniref:Geranylgeranylglyceryl phosphate synthase n=1 Tax=Candidatus Iainarchaeum sp. TaxID=3101447 RepID=A0A7J4JGR5_9ARCH|nr:geranylgeranylglyceryl/heptaprenylglyceryl phosphate synthase [Candidatus Diapherotrites archaeon]HIH16953.1 geranylgeranylglyceryl/heptaprenylglyceryl phosphate synthase [Candidatus Diapherotrites archaeon]